MPAEQVTAALEAAAEFKDKLLRTLAEMENLRKRTEREVADARLYGNAGFARDVLAVADNMHRALATIGPELREQADSKSRRWSKASSSPSANCSRCWRSTA